MVGADDTRRRVAAELVRESDRRLDRWRTLQEIAGVDTPFTDGATKSAEAALAAAHAAEIERLSREHQTRLAEVKAAFQTEATERLTRGLLAIVGSEGEDER